MLDYRTITFKSLPRYGSIFLEQTSPLEKLPNDILKVIFSLVPEQIFELSILNHRFHHLTKQLGIEKIRQILNLFSKAINEAYPPTDSANYLLSSIFSEKVVKNKEYFGFNRHAIKDLIEIENHLDVSEELHWDSYFNLKTSFKHLNIPPMIATASNYLNINIRTRKKIQVITLEFNPDLPLPLEIQKHLKTSVTIFNRYLT